MEDWKWFAVGVIVFVLLFVLSLCKVAGDGTREEERQEQNLQKEKESIKGG